MRRLMRALVLAIPALWLAPGSAAADVSAFLGASPTGATRAGRGLAAGAGLVAVGFEIEASRLAESREDAAPGLTTGMANLLVQTPIDISRTQFYGTAGAGVYRETLGSDRETAVASNVGGGVKIRLAGPLKLRVDYRLFRLQGTPRFRTWHRVYAGATLGF